MSDNAAYQRIADVEADREWLEFAYEQHASGLRRFVFGVTGDYQAAEDVVQATFAKAAQAGTAIQAAAIKSWLYRVAFHEAVTWKRRSGTHRKATRELWNRGHERRPERPEQSLVRRETVEQVREALQSLSAVQRQVVEARIHEDKTFVQIAAEKGLPLGTVLTHMRRALIKLRQVMDGKG